MNGQEKPKQGHNLLGGYATGNLSPQEQEVLMRAALEDQSLFDALMEEELLKEALEEPGAKTALLEALGPRLSAWQRFKQWWVTPLAWGAAGAVATACLVVGFLVTHPKVPQSPISETAAAKVAPHPAAAPPPQAPANAIIERKRPVEEVQRQEPVAVLRDGSARAHDQVSPRGESPSAPPAPAVSQNQAPIQVQEVQVAPQTQGPQTQVASQVPSVSQIRGASEFRAQRQSPTPSRLPSQEQGFSQTRPAPEFRAIQQVPAPVQAPQGGAAAAPAQAPSPVQGVSAGQTGAVSGTVMRESRTEKKELVAEPSKNRSDTALSAALGSPSAAKQAAIAASYSLMRRLEDGSFVAVGSGQAVAPGDQLRFQVTLPESGLVSLARRDDSGVQVLIPSQLRDAESLVVPRR